MSAQASNGRDPIVDFIVREARGLPCIEKIMLYGSRARGDNHERSDYDFAVFAPSMSRGQWAEWAAAGDDNVWKDVTTTSGGAASNCTTDGARCTMQDKITGLWWSKLQANVAWDTPWNTCQTTLNASGGYNGQTGWRLPTQKELMEAYTHGIRSAASTDWMTEANMNNYFWSGSSVSDSVNAWLVYLGNGITPNLTKSFTGQVVCVR